MDRINFWNPDLKIIGKNTYEDCLYDLLSILKLFKHKLQRNYCNFCSYNILGLWSTMASFFYLSA